MKEIAMRQNSHAMMYRIEKYKEVIEKYRYCWLGKIGRSPSEKVLKDVLPVAPGTVILY